ncbi:unnamed protein product, partial [Protopolystoma xenopodis]
TPDSTLTHLFSSTSKCASSPCQSRREDNINWVDSFNRRLSERPDFTCYLHQNDTSALLLHKLYSRELMLHSLVWPAVVAATSLMLILFTWLLAGCRVWGQDKPLIA